MIVAIDLVGPRTGGAITVAWNLLAHFSKLRPEWHFIIFSLPEAVELLKIPSASNIEYRTIPSARNNLGRVVWQQWTLPRLARNSGSDIILSLVNIAPKYSDIPRIVYYHQALHFTQDALFNRRSLRGYFTKMSVLSGFKNSMFIITQTQVMKNEILNQCRIPAEKVVCVPPGVPCPRPPMCGDREMLCHFEASLLKAKRPMAIYLSHPQYYKNFEHLFRVASLMKKENIAGSFLLSLDPDGTGTQLYKELVLKYLNDIRNMDIQDRILLIGRIPESMVSETLKQCDLLVFPSLVESFPQPLTEAMDVGLPLVLADRPYAKEIAKDAALYFNPFDDGSDLAKIMAKINSNDNLLASLRNSSKARTTFFDYEKASLNILRLIDQAVTRG